MRTPVEFFTKPRQKVVSPYVTGKGLKRGIEDMEIESNGEEQSSPQPSTSRTTPSGKGKEIGKGKGKGNHIKKNMINLKTKRKEKVEKSKKKNKPQKKRNNKSIFEEDDEDLPLATWIKKQKSDEALTNPSTSGIKDKYFGSNGKDDYDDIPLDTRTQRYKSDKAFTKPSTSGINNNAKKTSNKKQNKRSNVEAKNCKVRVSVESDLNLKKAPLKRYVTEVLVEGPERIRISEEAFKKVVGSADNFLTNLLKSGKKILEVRDRKILDDISLEMANDICYKNLFKPLGGGTFYIPEKKKSNRSKKKTTASSSAVEDNTAIAMPPPPSPAPLSSPTHSISASKGKGKFPRKKISSPPASPYSRPPASPRKSPARKGTSGKGGKRFNAALPAPASPAPVISMASQPSPVAATFPQQEYNQEYQNLLNVPTEMSLVPYNSQIQTFPNPIPEAHYQNLPTPPPHSPQRAKTPNYTNFYEPIVSPITPIFEENLNPVY